jgi:predicted NBD/HSP70 family sugar kinase
LAVGVGAPGPLDPEAGIIRGAWTLPGWEDVPLAGVIEERVGVAAIMGNDANVAALGELAYGAGRGAEHLVYLTISTGIGGGFVVGGKLLEGRRGAAGEVGHIVVEPCGPECSCGGRGHLEALASGTAIARQAREALSSGEDSILRKLSGGDPGRVTAELAHEAALAGDPLCIELIGAAGRRVGYTLVGLVHLFNPEVVVLNAVQHSASRRKETPLNMRHLQSPATYEFSLVKRLGQRFESTRRRSVLLRFAGKTQGTKRGTERATGFPTATHYCNASSLSPGSRPFEGGESHGPSSTVLSSA